MEYIKGTNFAPFPARGSFEGEMAKVSLLEMKQRTGANLVILTPAGYQEGPQSEKIDFSGAKTIGDGELCRMVDYAKGLGLRVAIKPTVNCDNGVWRAYINFFDNEVPCEPQWRHWFESHALFQTHYARMAEKLGCEMFVAGCEMVMAQRREAEWRALMAQLRADFHGLLSYNTDKYQEENVAWWDAVDVISSSGYYPLEDWENQLNRIEAVVKKHNKPFFFAEAGCMSIAGSAKVPNDWMLQGEPDEDEQAVWYEAMFAACQNRPWIQGFGLWDWPLRSDGTKDGGYSLHNKKAEQVVARHWKGAVE